MGHGAGYGSVSGIGVITGNITGTLELTGINLTNGVNLITHNLGAAYKVIGWKAFDSTGHGFSVNPPFDLTANTFKANFGGTESGCTLEIEYKAI